MQKDNQHKICVFEVLEGESLQKALLQESLPQHRTLEAEIKIAYEKGWICDEDAQKYIS